MVLQIWGDSKTTSHNFEIWFSIFLTKVIGTIKINGF